MIFIKENEVEAVCKTASVVCRNQRVYSGSPRRNKSNVNRVENEDSLVQHILLLKSGFLLTTLFIQWIIFTSRGYFHQDTYKRHFMTALFCLCDPVRYGLQYVHASPNKTNGLYFVDNIFTHTQFI